MLEQFPTIPVIYLGLIGSLIAGSATGIGAIPILFVKNISDRIQGMMLGFSAGVMLAATSFSLIIPGIEAAVSETGNNVYAAATLVAGIMIGGLFLAFS